MSELKTQGFHHITMVSADARRTLDFYRGTLGLGLVKKTVNFDDPGAYHLYFGAATGRPGTILTFFEWSHAPQGAPGVGGVHHLALGTDTEESLLRWKRRLTDHGVHVSGPYDRTWFHSIYFTDPDGQILEIATRGPGYGLDEPMEALGEREIRPTPDHFAGERDEEAIRARTHPEPVPVITPAMALSGIHHISGITDDVERAHDFYTGALGLRMVKRTVNQDAPTMPHWFWARYDGAKVAPHSSMTLFGIPRGKRARGGVGQTHHVAFRARDAEEQLAWREHLLGMGVQVSPVMERTYFRSIYFRAPDGLLLEIATDGPGFLVDEDPAELGRNLMLPAWLEPEREGIAASLAPLG
ncbi:MAG TPA: VOC family protein [Longimicrobiaceae bacterium]|nr:VOC family protein [Longimicrobiaceae bacterium]